MRPMHGVIHAVPHCVSTPKEKGTTVPSFHNDGYDNQGTAPPLNAADS